MHGLMPCFDNVRYTALLCWLIRTNYENIKITAAMNDR